MERYEKILLGLIIIILGSLLFLVGTTLKGNSSDATEYIFDLENIGLVSLRDIHDQYPNLTKLDILGIDLDDISDIRLFTKLTELDISSMTYLHDISPLFSLTNLRSLKATGNEQIEDWSVLSTLKNLEELTLTKHPDLDTSFTQHLNKFTKLELLEVWD